MQALLIGTHKWYFLYNRTITANPNRVAVIVWLLTVN